MPYTPPSHRSPASSTPSTPGQSRRSSFLANSPKNRPQLPRSASYLARHGRTQPAAGSADHHVDQLTPDATVDDLRAIVNNPSLRQSPPPVTGNRPMPSGAIISPPDSSSSGDEDDSAEVRGRAINNLKELHEAISQIPQKRESSPNNKPRVAIVVDDEVAGESQSQTSGSMRRVYTTGALDELAGLRKIAHSRSATEPNLSMMKSSGCSLAGSEEDSDGEMRKPKMVRKKSGEVVRPALRPASRRRPSSMPGTPTFGKAVHFDSHLEHVRHFLQVDRPLAVSAGASPVDTYDSDAEYPFLGHEKRTKSSCFELDIIMTNFPVETVCRKQQPVRLEKVWLSPDQKSLVGSVIVANLAYQKAVTCRFTLDYWKTTSEVVAEYVNEVQPRETMAGHDRFTFTIKLSDMANLETKTLFFCVRFAVNGQELWDNNDGVNFQVDFRKKAVSSNAAVTRSGGLPRSTRRPTSAPRPKLTVGLDGFGKHSVTFDQSIEEYLGDSDHKPLRLKGVRSSVSLPSDNLRLSAPSGQAFANRYDFGASLTAAVQAAKDSMSGKSDGLYMKHSRRIPGSPLAFKSQADCNTTAVTQNTTLPAASVLATVSGSDSPSLIATSSYEELVNKYCFFGTSKQTSPQLKDDNFVALESNDVAADRAATTKSSSPKSSPPINEKARSSTLHHTLHPKDSNPYFTPSMALSPIGPSPSLSPMAGLTLQRGDRFPFSGSDSHAATAIKG